ncbi:MAG: HAD family hydrolase [Bdellovibrionales bacterium]|jgi:phosphoglycolate phosphatase
MSPDQQAVIFDWNGTLLADTWLGLESMNKSLALAGAPPATLSRYRNEYFMPLRPMYMRLGCDAKKLEENLQQIFDAFGEHYEKHVHKTNLRRGAKGLLKTLKEEGRRAAILSNHTVEIISSQTQRLDIHHYFDAVLANGADEIKDIMHKADKGKRLKRYVDHHDIRKALVVGDSAEEVEIAHAYGFLGVGLAGGFSCEEKILAAKPDFMIRSLTELPPIVASVFGQRA